MNNFGVILRTCRALAKKPGLDIIYNNTEFSIKIKSGNVEEALKNLPQEPVAGLNVLHPVTNAKINFLRVTSENIGHFVHSVETTRTCPMKPGDMLREGQILGYCVFGEFCVPVRSPYSGILDCYLINEGEVMEYGTDLAQISVGNDI